jgi:hypothetical protein
LINLKTLGYFKKALVILKGCGDIFPGTPMFACMISKTTQSKIEFPREIFACLLQIHELFFSNILSVFHLHFLLAFSLISFTFY